MDFSLHELACLDEVIAQGSFQGAADKLHRTHSAVHAAVKNLEQRLGVPLLDRSQYRVILTPAGEAFRRQASTVLREAAALETLCQQLSQGEETDLSLVVGDLTPTDDLLRRLKHFFKAHPKTRLHLHFEVIGGPWERLLAEEADLIIHHIDKSDTRFEWLDLCKITLVPVVAPGFLAATAPRNVSPEHMRKYVQVVIRDTAKQAGRNYFVIEDAPRCTVADQHTKKALIMQGIGWGHMPLHLIERELNSGKLISLEGRHFKRSKLDIVAARLRRRPAGPVAQALWRYLAASE